MKKTLYQTILVTLVLFTFSFYIGGCSPTAPNSTATASIPGETQPSPTSTATSSPTATLTPAATTKPRPISITPTITAPSPREMALELPDGLEIEEYIGDDYYVIASQVSERYGNATFDPWIKNPMINGEFFTVEEIHKIVENQAAPNIIFSAKIGEKEVFSVECGMPLSQANLITTWTYKNHWYIQTFCNEKFTIFTNGVSLNEKLGYQESYAFQLLGGKPFYLFTREDKVWLFYDDTEVLLDYDEVLLHYCCMVAPPPRHFKNKIFFIARTGEQYFGVVIGDFSGP